MTDLERVDGTTQDGVLAYYALSNRARRVIADHPDIDWSARGLAVPDPLRPADTDDEPWSVALPPKGYSTTPLDVFVLAAAVVAALLAVGAFALYWRTR